MNNDNKILTPFILPACFVLLWSSGSIFAAIGLHYLNPITFVFWRFLFTALLMLLIALLTQAPWPRSWREVGDIVLAGLFVQFGYLVSYACGMHYGIAPGLFAVVLSLQPLLTGFISATCLNKPLSVRQWGGLFIGLGGVLLVVVSKFRLSHIDWVGLFFAGICLLSITVGSLLQMRCLTMDLRSGGVIQAGISLIPTAVIAFFYTHFALPLQPVFLFSLAWMVIGVSIGGIALYYILLRRQEPVKTTSLLYLVPAVTAVMSYFSLGEVFNIYMIAGMIIAMLGVLLTMV